MPLIDKIFFKIDRIWNELESIQITEDILDEYKGRLSFISLEGYNRLQMDSAKGFCHLKFRGNFVIDNVDTKHLEIGQLIELGGSMVKITMVHKDCYEECPVYKNTNSSCNVNRYIFFAELLEEGKVEKRDNFTIRTANINFKL